MWSSLIGSANDVATASTPEPAMIIVVSAPSRSRWIASAITPCPSALWAKSRAPATSAPAKPSAQMTEVTMRRSPRGTNTAQIRLTPPAASSASAGESANQSIGGVLRVASVTAVPASRSTPPGSRRTTAR